MTRFALAVLVVLIAAAPPRAVVGGQPVDPADADAASDHARRCRLVRSSSKSRPVLDGQSGRR
jgi:hypothetical protein